MSTLPCKDSKQIRNPASGRCVDKDKDTGHTVVYLQREIERGTGIRSIIMNAIKCPDDHHLYNPALDKCVDATRRTGPTLNYFINPTQSNPMKKPQVVRQQPKPQVVRQQPKPQVVRQQPKPQVVRQPPRKETYLWQGIDGILSYLYGRWIRTPNASTHMTRRAMTTLQDYAEGIINLAKRSSSQEPGNIRHMRSVIMQRYPEMMKLQAQEYVPSRPWGLLQASAFPYELIKAYELEEFMPSTSQQNSFLQVLEFLVREALRRAVYDAPVQTDHWKPYWKLWTEWTSRQDARIDEPTMQRAIDSLDTRMVYHCTASGDTKMCISTDALTKDALTVLQHFLDSFIDAHGMDPATWPIPINDIPALKDQKTNTNPYQAIIAVGKYIVGLTQSDGQGTVQKQSMQDAIREFEVQASQKVSFVQLWKTFEAFVVYYLGGKLVTFTKRNRDRGGDPILVLVGLSTRIDKLMTKPGKKTLEEWWTSLLNDAKKAMKNGGDVKSITQSMMKQFGPALQKRALTYRAVVIDIDSFRKSWKSIPASPEHVQAVSNVMEYLIKEFVRRVVYKTGKGFEKISEPLVNEVLAGILRNQFQCLGNPDIDGPCVRHIKHTTDSNGPAYRLTRRAMEALDDSLNAFYVHRSDVWMQEMDDWPLHPDIIRRLKNKGDKTLEGVMISLGHIVIDTVLASKNDTEVPGERIVIDENDVHLAWASVTEYQDADNRLFNDDTWSLITTKVSSLVPERNRLPGGAGLITKPAKARLMQELRVQLNKIIVDKGVERTFPTTFYEALDPIDIPADVKSALHAYQLENITQTISRSTAITQALAALAVYIIVRAFQSNPKGMTMHIDDIRQTILDIMEKGHVETEEQPSNTTSEWTIDTSVYERFIGDEVFRRFTDEAKKALDVHIGTMRDYLTRRTFVFPEDTEQAMIDAFPITHVAKNAVKQGIPVQIPDSLAKFPTSTLWNQNQGLKIKGTKALLAMATYIARRAYQRIDTTVPENTVDVRHVMHVIVEITDRVMEASAAIRRNVPPPIAPEPKPPAAAQYFYQYFGGKNNKGPPGPSDVTSPQRRQPETDDNNGPPRPSFTPPQRRQPETDDNNGPLKKNKGPSDVKSPQVQSPSHSYEHLMTQLEKELLQTQGQRNDFARQFEATQKELNEVQRELSGLETRIENSTESAAGIIEERNNLTARLKTAEAESESRRKQLVRIEAERDRLKEDLRILQNKVKDSDSRIQTLERDVEARETQVKTIREQYASFKNNLTRALEQTKDSFGDSLREIEVSLTNLGVRLRPADNYNAENGLIKLFLDRLRQITQDMTAHVVDQRQAYEQLKQQHGEEIAQLIQEGESTHRSRVAQLHQQHSEDIALQRTEFIQQYDDAIKQLEKDYMQELNNHIDTVARENDELRQSLGQMTAERNELQQNYNDRAATLIAYQQNITALQSSIQKLIEEKETVQRNITALQATLENRNAEIVKLKKAYDLEIRLRALKRRRDTNVNVIPTNIASVQEEQSPSSSSRQSTTPPRKVVRIKS
jgi:predicted  nucleic acid-binding Zn-ribbon protein